ncbi:uncharacterized GPI-anchored protein At1g61900-like [Ipomoea triloba]|uniref:uncharacterized GPI-anchored protein At1g61900-like n=1 Tax=Ipomoea triloba TaxID=35885 RepID=UPI00125D39A4|nr:uncharacterized GPI-anchored protein At1g61900-like [Ipomoea triloba]
MRKGVAWTWKLYHLNVFLLLLLLCLHDACCSPLNNLKSSGRPEKTGNGLLPQTSPTAAPEAQPLLPLLAPSPLAPFTNSTVPELSGSCPLNFAALGSMISMTSIDCAAPFAKYLANVMCCPQLETTLVVLVGQNSKYTNTLALNATLAEHCLSDFQKILESRGANDTLQQICSLNPSNLTEGSCPISDLHEFEATVDTSSLLSACGRIDLVNECCEQICQTAISEAARKLALKAYDLPSMGGSHVLSDQSPRANDCKRIVLRWLASKLEPSGAKDVLRGLSSCKNNRVCPLVFPNMGQSIKACDTGINNETACCRAMEKYVSHLQRQSFVTNLQALDCAASLGMKLQKANVTQNVYNLCHITLKDFSVQVTPEVSGCLLPSLPSDAILDQTTGISFVCDLNDNIPAPWPSASQSHASTCNKTVRIPALPAAASGQTGLYISYTRSLLLVVVSTLLVLLLP